MSLIKSPAQIDKIRQSARILAAALRTLREKAAVGVNLLELEEVAKQVITDHGAKPAFLGYQPYGARKPYPYALCTSLGEVVVHGLPTDYILKSGDVLKMDLGVDWRGGISDAAITVPIGDVSKEDRKLIKLTRKALLAGVGQVAPGKTTGDIGHAIEQTVLAGGGKIIEGLTGHGVGEAVHEEPAIFNFGEPGDGEKLVPGMVIAIEPMVSLESGRVSQLNDDSYATIDNSTAAHFEHTILVTKNGHEVLTQF